MTWGEGRVTNSSERGDPGGEDALPCALLLLWADGVCWVAIGKGKCPRSSLPCFRANRTGHQCSQQINS